MTTYLPPPPNHSHAVSSRATATSSSTHPPKAQDSQYHAGPDQALGLVELAGVAVVGCHSRDEDARPPEAEADVLAEVGPDEGRAERGRGRAGEELRGNGEGTAKRSECEAGQGWRTSA